jgi:glyoxylase-like metal-dependent hydrolase (beta-lactamase superfamily II)
MTERRARAEEAVDADAPVGPKPLVPEVASALSPLVRRIVCNNPGMMTGPGTNTYLVGVDEIVVVDPGPDDATHLDAIAGCGGDAIRWIVCTHTHPDHSPGAAGLKARTGAEVLAFDARDGLEIDRSFADGDGIEATEFRLSAIHTPGHASNHLCFQLEEERLLFSGDHIMGESTVVINPPDGDMAAYLASLERLRALRPPLRAIAPAHGHLIERPNAKIDEYLTHRRAREAQVIDALRTAGSEGAGTEALVAAIYTDVPEILHPVARRSVWAHLRKLGDEGDASSVDPDDPDAPWVAA